MTTDSLTIPTVGALISNQKLQTEIYYEPWTLTQSRFEVTDVLVLSRDSDQEALLQYAASVEAISALPIAKAISASSRQQLSIEGFRSSRGRRRQADSLANG